MSEEPRETSADFDTPPPSGGGVVDVYEPSPRTWRSSTAWRWTLRVSLVLAGMAIVAIFGLLTGGKRELANVSLAYAYGNYSDGDLPGAIGWLDQGIAWFPDDSMLFFTRAQFREESHDLEGSLADYNRVIELAPDFALAYSERSRVYQRMDRHAEAIADLERARDLRPTGEASPLNDLAYGRALAGVDLEQGLAEIQQAIEQEKNSREIYSFLDTRGLLYHLLGRNEEALVDLNRAIELAESARGKDLARAAEQKLRETQMAWLKQMLDRPLAVLYHHRSEVHRALEHAEQADFDLRRGDELGYSRELGVF